MEEIYTNIYKESRKKAGLEQSEAAELIGVSYHALAKYEKKINAVIPHDDIVRNMVIAYNDRSLAYKHIKASPLGEFLPDFANSKSLTVATLSFLSDFKAIEGMLAQIIEVTKDGKIDKSEYGADSNVVRVRVHGLFPLAEDDVFIPFSDVEKAMMLDFGEEHEVLKLSLGVDVARYGDDETVIFSNASNLITLEHRRTKQDLMVTAGTVVQKYKELAARYPDYHGLIFVYIDDTGMGGGVTDRLREVKYEEGLHRMVIVPVNFASSPPEFAGESYTNISGYMWGVVKELLRQRALYLPNDEELSAQLTTRKYKVNSKGKIEIESKEALKKRHLPSPDMGDALALSCYTANMVYLEYLRLGRLAYVSKTQSINGQITKIYVGVSLIDKNAGVAFVAAGVIFGYRGMIILRSEVCPTYDSESLKANIYKFCGDVSKQYGRVDSTYVDADEYTLQQELKKNAMRYGVNAKMRLAANLKESDLIRLTNSMFQRGMLQLTSECKDLSIAFSSSIYTDKNDKERKVNNINLLRAFEYTLERDSSKFTKV